MTDKCVLCEGKLSEKIADYKIYGKSIGKFPALVCGSCGEQWFNEEIAKKIQEKEKTQTFRFVKRN